MNKLLIGLNSFLLVILSLNFEVRASEGYYKDLFMDGGVGLNSRTTLPAADALGLDYEYLADEDTFTNNIIIVNNSDDENGFLLYPDGKPRFKVIFTNGGNADIHGSVLGELGRENIRTFYLNGGSYTGSCAGAILATINTNTWLDPEINTNYYNIWPARAHFTQLTDSYTSIKIPEGSPLLSYQDFGIDSAVEEVLHNGGVFVKEDDDYYWAPNTELLATYSEPILGNDTSYYAFFGHGAVWAYKDNLETGRIVITGSHPEGVNYGEQQDLMKSILQYAIDGVGGPIAKGELSIGSERFMNDNSKSGYEKIGDKQYHHFIIKLKKDTPVLSIHLNGEEGYNFNLYLNLENFAFKSNAIILDTSSGSDKSISLENVSAGSLFVSVECDTTIDSKKHSWGYTYEGAMELMNGIPYSILVDNKTGSNPYSMNEVTSTIPFVFIKSKNSVYLTNSSDLNFELKLFDLRGRVLWSYNKQNNSKTDNQIFINKDIGKGTFILHYSDDRKKHLQQLIINN